MKPAVSLGVPQALGHTVNVIGLDDHCRSLLAELFCSICHCHKCSHSNQAKVGACVCVCERLSYIQSGFELFRCVLAIRGQYRPCAKGEGKKIIKKE